MPTDIRRPRRGTTSALSLFAFAFTALLGLIAVTPRRRERTPLAGSDGIVLI
jgi:hypothetical protein